MTVNVYLGALLFVLPLACSRGYADSAAERRAAAVLLQRYETVASARSQIVSRLYRTWKENDAGSDATRKCLGLPFVESMGGLKAAGPNTLVALASVSDLILTGAKDFVAPAGLGMVASHSSTIAILSAGAARSLSPEFRNVKVESIDGRSVWSWSMAPSEGYHTPTGFYAAIVGSSFFVLADDRGEFQAVVNALAAGSVQDTALLSVDSTLLRTHAYWAYRAIRRREGMDGLEALASGVNTLPKSTVSLSLFTEFDDGKLLFDVQGPDGRAGSVPAGLPSSEAIQFGRAGIGVWRATISLTTPQTMYALFQVLSYFGYGVFL